MWASALSSGYCRPGVAQNFRKIGRMIGDERHQAGRVVRNEAAHERAFVMRHRTSMRQARDRFRGLRLFPRAALLPGGRDAVRAPCGGGHGHPLHGRDATRMQRRIVGRTHPFRRLVQSGERARVTRYMAGTSLPVRTPVCRQKKTPSPREELGRSTRYQRRHREGSQFHRRRFWRRGEDANCNERRP